LPLQLQNFNFQICFLPTKSFFHTFDTGGFPDENGLVTGKIWRVNHI